MENYIDHPFQLFIQKASKKTSASGSSKPSSLMEMVMPLYQVIRFANQAFEKKQIVYITIEKQVANGQYSRTVLKGKFRSKINTNKQITFSSPNHAVLHLLKIEQILAVQLAK